MAIALIGAAIAVLAGDLVLTEYKLRFGAQLYFYAKAVTGGVVAIWIYSLFKRQKA